VQNTTEKRVVNYKRQRQIQKQKPTRVEKNHSVQEARGGKVKEDWLQEKDGAVKFRQA
jgi:hypothetical protein